MEAPQPQQPTGLVDDSLSTTFRRVRLPSVGAAFVLVVALSIAIDWRTGFWPTALTAVAMLHAVYERFQPEAPTEVGLAMDITLYLYLTWLLDAPEVVVAIGMTLGVLVAYFNTGRARVALLVLLAVAMLGALGVPSPYAWNDSTLQAVVSRMVPFYTLGLIVALFSAATANLRKAEIQRGYVVGTVAHELRNDLTPVVGLALLLADEAKALERADLAEMAEMIARQGLDASGTVEDLLTLARLDRSALELRIEPLAVLGEIEDVVTLMGTTIDVTSGKGGDAALGDSTRVRQIIRNLCSNAARYGGDHVRVEVDVLAGDECHVLVRDNGPGIAANEVMTIFEPFGRGAAGRREATSVGLGLWISRQLAVAMNGDLTYRRESGWTVFDLRLPAATPTFAMAG